MGSPPRLRRLSVSPALGRWLPSLGLVAIAISSLVASCGVGDQICPDDTLASDTDDECPYGPPGGPQKKKLARECPLVVFDMTDCAGVSFETNVFPIFAIDPNSLQSGNGNCTSTGCHGTTQDALSANGLQFADTITPLELYTRLSDYKNPQGDPYWAEGNDHAWVQCNIVASPGGGSPMPKPGGLTLESDQTSILKWVACGMKPPGTTMGTGGAGGAMP